MDQRLAGWAIDERDFPHGGSRAEQLRFLLGYAILAPSGHNSQPWLFRLQGDSLELHEDRSRTLPVVDPDRRELVISCGVALEFLLVAMRRFGLTAALDLEPEGGDSTCLARVHCSGSEGSDETSKPLVQAMTARRSNRLAFEDRVLPGSMVAGWQDVARDFAAKLILIPHGPEREEVARLIEESTCQLYDSAAFREELARWVTPNGGPRTDGMPGYAHGLNSLVARFSPLVLRRFNLGPSQGKQDRQKALQAPVLALLSTAHDERVDALRAGRALAQILLRARADGVWASFFNQPVELPVARRRLSRIVEDDVPQLLLRFGYAPDVKPTPRRGVDELVA
jgi:hypothetical protein